MILDPTGFAVIWLLVIVGGILALLGFAFWIWMLVHSIKTKNDFWIVILLVTLLFGIGPIIAAIVYYFMVYRKKSKKSKKRRKRK